jgi:hypothetical protein
MGDLFILSFATWGGFSGGGLTTDKKYPQPKKTTKDKTNASRTLFSKNILRVYFNGS